MNTDANTPHRPADARSNHDRARELMAETASRDRIPGMSVAIASPDRLLYAGAIGYADLRTRRASTVEDQYPWFSMTKIATATTAMSLHAEGILDLDLPIGTYLPGYRAHATHGHPTTRQLLSHTAGLGNPLPVRWVRAADQAPDPDFVAQVMTRYGTPRRRVGARAAYSNIGYVLAGEVIASVTGATVEASVRDRVLEPLGMQQTGYDYQPDAPRAVGYVRAPRVAVPLLRALLPHGIVGARVNGHTALNPFLVEGAAYGGLVGTAADAVRLAAAHTAHSTDPHPVLPQPHLDDHAHHHCAGTTLRPRHRVVPQTRRRRPHTHLRRALRHRRRLLERHAHLPRPAPRHGRDDQHDVRMGRRPALHPPQGPVMDMTPADITRARRDTPGVAHVAHLNNAGAALPPSQVTDAVVAHLRREAEIGGYEAAAEAHEQVEHTYDAVARLIGCQASEIAIVENATRAWDMAFYALPFAPGDRILTARAEYSSNVIAFLQVAARTGAVVEVVDNDESGQLSVDDLRRRLADGNGPVKLVAVTHVPTQGGLVNPAEEIGHAAREAGVPYLLDACQSVGQLPIDVERIGCDFLSATGRKYLRGPRGTGFLYVRSTMIEHVEPPFLDLHAATWTAPDRYQIRPDARRFENWETNYAAKIGLGVAVDYAMSWGIDAISDRVTTLADQLREQLSGLKGVRVHDQGRQRCGIVTFTVDGVDATEVQHRLAQHGVNVSVSLREYARLDLPDRGLPDLVRASVHYYNNETELQALIDALPRPR